MELHTILISALDVGEQSVSHSGRFNTTERTVGTNRVSEFGNEVWTLVLFNKSRD